MQNKRNKWVNRFIALLAIGFISSTTLISFTMKKAADDIWQKLGISQSKGDENIKASFLNGYFHYYGAKTAKNLLVNDRAAVAKDLLNYSKQKLSSDAFRKDYEKLRNSAKPVEYPYTAKSKEEVRKEKIAEMQKSITDAEALVKKMPDMAKTMQPTIDMFKNNLKDYQDPNSQMIELYYQNELHTKKQREDSYKESMERWQKEYPANVNTMIRERLQKFVTLAKTVDFNAQLKEVGGKKKFVNPQYEGQNYEWKQIFRAGKEVIIPAISFAEQWIKELN